ncbi:MAG: PD-(D/E)XK nuclease family protein [Bacteroidales bacterium]|nr:PD-(D/E)XK nuclease family protein [Bacteroidales bacterium]
MHDEFLRLVARAYVKNEAEIENHGMPFGKTLFVFPNRRSMKFFQKYLGEEFGKVYGKPLFSPQMLTISELFSEISGLAPVDPIEAKCILYRKYICLKYPSEPFEKAAERETFDEFVHWSSILLSDFNDIDKYLIDARQLFTNIKDLKQLDSDYSFLSPNQRMAVEKFWSSFLNGGENFKKESFSLLWSIMYNLYESFRGELESRGEGYEGMIYRKVAENLDSCSHEKVVFIGFNAPNKCEKALMKWLKERGRGDFYWDFYGPMVTDKENKASMFIREAVKELPSKYEIDSQHTIAEIHAVGIPSGVGQAFVAADILDGLRGTDPIKTAVVLPDETLLMPLLNSIPKQFNKINVTMGYPVTATPLVSFIGGIAALQRDIRVKDGKVSFYHGSIEALLKHEYVKEYAWNDAVAIIRNLVQENLIYLASDSPVFGQMESPLLKLIFKVPENAMELLDYLTDILKQLDLVADTLNKEFIYRYYLAIERLRRVEIPMRKETCIRLLSQITSSITIPFKGEPLAGLQVIGSLEVRALDFENLIILSVNEGRFPKSSQSDSLIPYNLRIGFGLPTYELHDAIAAYHFYRSIYRAKNVWLIYDTRTEGLKSGEVSRFVKQLEYHYNVDIKKSVAATPPLLDTADTPIVVEKSPQVMEKLHELFIGDGGKKSLSASSINTYLACPLQFYLQYVEGFKDEESVEESIEASTFGTIFHDTMEELYSAYQGEIVSEEIIDSIMKGRKRLDEVIGRMFSKSRIQEISGRNIIVKEVIKKYVLITLQEDKKYAPFTYIAGEKTFYHKLELPDGNNVRIKAVIDRIDISSEVLRVIDYKTGGVEVPKKDMPVNEFFVRDSGKHYKAFVQLYLYALILSELSDEKGALALDNGRSARVDFSEDQSNFSVVVYPVTAIKKSSIVCEPIYKGKLEEYKAALMECVAEIFDPQTPFLQACQGSDVCAYCMFRQICGR